MASKRRSFISLIFIINCITKCSLIRISKLKKKYNRNQNSKLHAPQELFCVHFTYQVCEAFSKGTIGGFAGRGRQTTSCNSTSNKINVQTYNTLLHSRLCSKKNSKEPKVSKL